MCSLVPSDSETVPVPDHAPSNPANGLLDCAWLAVIDNMSAAPTAADLTACPNKPETNNFIWCFPVKIDALLQDTSRRIVGLVSPWCLWFKMAARPRPCDLLQNTQSGRSRVTFFQASASKKASRSRAPGRSRRSADGRSIVGEKVATK
jgi:hypothetical protein